MLSNKIQQPILLYASSLYLGVVHVYVYEHKPLRKIRLATCHNADYPEYFSIRAPAMPDLLIPLCLCCTGLAIDGGDGPEGDSKPALVMVKRQGKVKNLKAEVWSKYPVNTGNLTWWITWWRWSAYHIACTWNKHELQNAVHLVLTYTINPRFEPRALSNFMG